MWFLPAWLVACAGPTVDSAACDPEVDGWANFGEGFVRQECQVCHASDATERHGAPPEVTFDTEAEVLARASRILARAAADPPTMPPTGATRASDRARLRRWLTCAAQGAVTP